jgi:hypothetical protein
VSILSDITNFTPVVIVQSDTTVYNPPLKGVLVTLDGTLVVEDVNHVTHSFVIPAAATGGRFPCFIAGRFRRVLAATTQADASLHGYR